METTNSRQVSDWLSIWKDQPRLRDRARLQLADEVFSVMKKYLPPDGLVLEGGCGPGDWVWCLRSLGYRVVGLDFCEPVLHETHVEDPTLPFTVGDVTDLPLRSGCLDAVISLGVVEHFENGPYAALLEARRVLRPGGILLVSVPHMNGLRSLPLVERLRKNPFLRRLAGKKLEFWQYKFTRKQLRSFLTATGFEIEELLPLYHEEGFVFDLPFLGSRQRQYRANPVGKAVAMSLKAISPWITNHMVIAVARRQCERLGV